MRFKTLAFAAALAVAGGAAAARADSTLVIGIAADPTGFDAEAVENNTSGFVMSTVYDSLLRYKPGTTAVAPGIAESWDVSPDGLTYTFHLKRGVKFSDGTPLDAKAVIWNVDRLLNKANPQYIYNTGPVEGYIDFTYGDVASYRAVDDNTVEFKFKKPSAPFLNSLAMVWNGLVSPAAAAKWGKDYRNHPVGSGPFIFREWRQRDEIILDANPNYWGGKPKVDHLIFKELPDPQAAVLALKQGDIQILADLSTQSVPVIKHDPTITLLTQPGLAVSGVAIPVDVPPFNDPRVRQALNYAVDKTVINKALYADLAVPMTSPLPQAQWGFDKSLPGYPYDVAKAKALLKEAGVKPGTQVELLTYNSPRGYNPAGPNLAIAIQGFLKKVGIVASVRQLEIGAYFSLVRSGTYKGLMMEGWTGDNGDPDNFLSELWGAANIPIVNWSRYNNPKVESLLSQALVVSDPAKRTALYDQAQKTILDDAPWIFVNSTLQIRAIRNNVEGYQLNPTQMFFGMENVSLK
ncbi:ABC transporter substrate-binding protein [Acidisoma silvae]|uniref:ABC transporter substrate-binding protein n=1 Tax=Acidisoma silvae TaxID=2802396 RepID=A0A964E1B9_9PROT|nr:ABC transporter substrate-binding protein [Acidisoma silvae]MCB8878191.1 ABC transporter substrate-binding protein [Acidisoma silvae]